MNKHLTTLEQSKKLKEIGFKNDSYFYWRYFKRRGGVMEYESEGARLDTDKCEYSIGDEGYSKTIPAYTLSELIEVLGEKNTIELTFYPSGSGAGWNGMTVREAAFYKKINKKSPIDTIVDLILKLHQAGLLSFKDKENANT